MDEDELREKRMVDETRALLRLLSRRKSKLNRAIVRLEKARRNIHERLRNFKYLKNVLIKCCPFCGGYVNPFTAKKYQAVPRTFECEECKRVFSVILRRIKL